MPEQDKLVQNVLDGFIRYNETAGNRQKSEVKTLHDNIIASVKEIKQPDIKITIPEINVPEIKIPEIKVPQVIVQERPINDVTVTGFGSLVKMLSEKLDNLFNKRVDLSGITVSNPVPVSLVHDGKFYKAIEKMLVGGAGGYSSVNIKNKSEAQINPATSENQDTGNTTLSTIATNTTHATISTNNSSTTPLGISGVFTGTADDISQYSQVGIILKTDKNSATNGLSLQWSSNGTNWDHVETYTIVGGTEFVAQVMVEARYFRIVYTNTTQAQTYFRLQTILRKVPIVSEVLGINEVIDDSDDAMLVRAILNAKNPAGVYGNINRTAGGNLKVSIEEQDAGAGLATSAKQNQYYDLEDLAWTNNTGLDGAQGVVDYHTLIGTNKITGHSLFRGFGQRSALSAAVGGDDVWEGTATTCPIPDQTTGDLMTIVSTSANDASAGTGTQTVDVHYIDVNGAEQSTIVTMNGVTPVDIPAIYMKFIQSIHSDTVGTGGMAAGTISIYKTGAAATVYNVIVPGGNMSLNSARMVPAGKTFYMTGISACGASGKSMSVKLRATSTFEDVVTPGYFFLFKNTCFLLNSTCVKNFTIPLKFPALCIIKSTAYSSQAGGDIAFSFDGWIE